MRDFLITTNIDEEQRSRIKSDFANFSRSFAIASTAPRDLIPLLARGEREQTAVAKAVVQKANQPGARLPLPRLYMTSNSPADTTSIEHSLEMATIHNAAAVEPPLESAGRVPPKVAIPRTTTSDNASSKTFAMQNREVDAVKAATPVLAPSKSYSQFPNNDHVRKEPLKSDHKGEGASSKNLVPNGECGPQKTKTKGYKNKNKNVHQSHSEDRPPPASSEQPADTQQRTGGSTAGNPDLTHQGSTSRVGTKEWSGGDGAQEQRCYTCGSLGHLSRDCKPNAGDATLPPSGGTFRGGGRGRGGRGGGGPGRSNRSNTIDESRAPQHLQMQINDGFRSGRGDSRRLFDDKTTHVSKNTTSQSTPRESPLPQDNIPTYGPTPDGMAFVTPSGAWYPSYDAHALMAQQVYGSPPPFIPQHASQQMKLSPQARNQTLRLLPIAPTEDGKLLPPPPYERTPTQALGAPAGGVLAGKSGGFRNTPSVNSAATLVEPSQIRVSKRETNTKTSPAKDDPPYIDPRPAHIRIESVMKSIAGELEYIKTRVHPAAKHGIKPEDMTRYLDMCMGLCKHVSKAAADLVGENEALKSHIMTSRAKAVLVAAPSGHDIGGMKIGSTPHSRTHSHTLSKISANKVQVSNYVLPSGAQSIYPPLVPQYDGYLIDK